MVRLISHMVKQALAMFGVFFVGRKNFSLNNELIDNVGRILTFDVFVHLSNSGLNPQNKGFLTFTELESLKRKATPSDKIIALGLFSKDFTIFMTIFWTIFKD